MSLDRDIGAESVKRAVRQIHHAADAEDQRQAERDQQVVASEHEAVDHLFQQEHEWDSQTIGAGRDGGSIAAEVQSPDASAEAPASSVCYKVQGFCSFVGSSTSSGSFAPGTAAPSARKSHLSFACALRLDRERIGLLHQLMIPVAEIGLARLEDSNCASFSK